jgi:transcriptional regulator with PAS, ATPase and Fis domain
MTNRDIYKLVKEKKFREDLFFRLRVHELHVPPLRERREDIPGLIKYFARVYSEKNGIIPGGFSESFGDCLFNYDWPGNIRELKNEIARIMEIIEDHELISDHHILPAISGAGKKKETGKNSEFISPIKETVRSVERENIRSLLEQNKGNKTRTAKMIGMSYRGFLKKIKRLHID